ncbi:DUF1223 domain-containing protein [Hymenobacter sp. BT664]|uniref:DUF1223 domain-containing protein n=1 Tax=Hymenobacter montanus TaxID=2771359 RepID=A0A927BBW7_9BACT|nr:DUF1223 domain-containing protein [Hymenobacter montanus]MBD2767611.1 DUF1223 domain-containing protein [Hymenobacter montanus]
MKRIALTLFPLLTVASATALTSARMMSSPRAPNPGVANVPVVVELFTSEGCSSCPAADAALRELETSQSLTGVEVIALGQHVDYWNRLGWKDPFSSPEFTERQREYAKGFGEGTYTPQAVVNGTYEFVGSSQELAETVLKAAKAPRATVSLARAANGALAVNVSQLPAGTKAADVLLALTEAGLSSQVGRGENSGRLLRHASVVRALRPLGTVRADGTFMATVPLDLARQWNPRNLRAVVLVQEHASRHIVGVGALALAGGAALN